VQQSQLQRFDRRSLQAVHTALERASMAVGTPLAEVVVEPPGAGALAKAVVSLPATDGAAASAALLDVVHDIKPVRDPPACCCIHLKYSPAGRFQIDGRCVQHRTCHAYLQPAVQGKQGRRAA
jgi:hypothetical protein